MDPDSVLCGQVEMDMEDENDEGLSTAEGIMPEKSKEPTLDDDAPLGISRTSSATHLCLSFVGITYSNSAISPQKIIKRMGRDGTLKETILK